MKISTFPEAMNFKDWINRLSSDHPNFYIPNYEDESKWREWANQFLYQNKLTTNEIPSDLKYPDDNDWKDWAYAFTYTYG